MKMNILQPQFAGTTKSRGSCPSWCENHHRLTVAGDDLMETHTGSVGYVIGTDYRDGIVDVGLATYRFSLDGVDETAPAKIEIRHEGHDISLGPADARVLAELLMAAAHTLGTSAAYAASPADPSGVSRSARPGTR